MSDEMKWGQEPEGNSAQPSGEGDVQQDIASARETFPTEQSTAGENRTEGNHTEEKTVKTDLSGEGKAEEDTADGENTSGDAAGASEESENVTYHYKYTRSSERPASHPYSASRMNQDTYYGQSGSGYGSQGTASGGEAGSPRYAHYQVNQDQPEDNKRRKNTAGHRPKSGKQEASFGKKAGNTITLAVIFGLVAALVFQGVNTAFGRFNKEESPVGTTETVPSSAGSDSTLADVANQSGNVAAVAEAAMPSVVAITSVSMQEFRTFFGYGEYPSTGSGSGIIVGENDDELLIATNNHVVEGATTLNVCFIGSDVVNVEQETANYAYGSGDLDIDGAVSAKIKGTDEEDDLAVIAVEKKDIPEDTMSALKIAQIGDSDELVLGEQVVAIGNALGYGQTVTSGWISALNRTVETDSGSSEDLIQTDAAINPGNSGGALLNMRGELIGINCAKVADNDVEGIGYAIPISKAQPILENLMSRETREKVEDSSKAAYLGIEPSDLTTEAIQMYHMPSGVFVTRVVEGEAADKAGIQKNDIITKLDGQKVSSKADLNEKLQYYIAGEEVEIVIARAYNGEYQEETVTVTLGARPEE